MRTLLCCIVGLTFWGSLYAEERLSLQLPDLTGTTHEPLKDTTKSATVIAFVSPYCPTSNTLMKELTSIITDYLDKASFYVVHADASTKEADVMQHTEMFSVKATVLLDKNLKLATHLQASITPEVVVLDKAGTIQYQGRINDLYLGPTKRQRQATTKDLRDALDAVLAGVAVANPKTEAMGCKIK